MIKTCICCNELISAERLEALPETEFCISCARNIKTKRVREFATCFGIEDSKEQVEECVEMETE